jgi:hypothetical protein
VTSRDVADVMRAASPVSVLKTYVPAGLEVARVEVVAGARYDLYAEPELARFQRDWARGHDGRRRRWWQHEVAGSVLGGRSDLSARSVRDAEQRARERRAAFAKFLRTGRRTKETSVRWAELYEELFGGATVAAALGEPTPKPLQRCLEVALLDYLEHPEDWPDYEPAQLRADAARKVYRALGRQGVL